MTSKQVYVYAKESAREREKNKNKMDEQHVRQPRSARIVHIDRMRVCGWVIYEREREREGRKEQNKTNTIYSMNAPVNWDSQ